MLDNLVKALGDTQFANLLSGFLAKSDEIIDHIEIAAKERNLNHLGSRAHDLKGMAGNFGMTALSDIASDIEKAAKIGDLNLAITKAATLRQTGERTKASLRQRNAA